MKKIEQGFSLIEILISMVILLTAITAIVMILPQGLRQITLSGRISTMNHLAQQKLDQLRSLSYNSRDLLEGTHPSTGLTPADPGNVETVTRYPITQSAAQVPSGFSRKWRVFSNDPAQSMKRIVVEVGYEMYDANGNPLPSDKMNQMNVVVSTSITAP